MNERIKGILFVSGLFLTVYGLYAYLGKGIFASHSFQLFEENDPIVEAFQKGKDRFGEKSQVQNVLNSVKNTVSETQKNIVQEYKNPVFSLEYPIFYAVSTGDLSFSFDENGKTYILQAIVEENEILPYAVNLKKALQENKDVLMLGDIFGYRDESVEALVYIFPFKTSALRLVLPPAYDMTTVYKIWDSLKFSSQQETSLFPEALVQADVWNESNESVWTRLPANIAAYQKETLENWRSFSSFINGKQVYRHIMLSEPMSSKTYYEFGEQTILLTEKTFQNNNTQRKTQLLWLDTTLLNTSQE